MPRKKPPLPPDPPHSSVPALPRTLRAVAPVLDPPDDDSPYTGTDTKRLAALRAFRRRLRPLELRAIDTLQRILELDTADSDTMKTQIQAAKLVFEQRHGAPAKVESPPAPGTAEITERRTVRIGGSSADYIDNLRRLRDSA